VFVTVLKEDVNDAENVFARLLLHPADAFIKLYVNVIYVHGHADKLLNVAGLVVEILEDVAKLF